MNARVMSIEFGDDRSLVIQYADEAEMTPNSSVMRTVYLSRDGVDEREHVAYWAAELRQAAEEMVAWWDKYQRGVAQ